MKKTIGLILALAAVLLAAGLGYKALTASAEPESVPLTAAATQAPVPAAEEEEDRRMTAPDFTVRSLEGESLTLSQCRGEPVVINFWATWCPPCRGELPGFQKAWETYGDRVRFVMVDLTDGVRETEEGVRLFLEENGYTFPVYLDTDYSAAGSYGISSIPLTVLVDAEGVVLGGQVGAVSEEALMGALADMVGE